MVDPLEAIYPDSNNTQSWNKEWTADYISDTDITCHVVVKVAKNSFFRLTASINGEHPGKSVFSELIDVPVEQNTGIDSRTKQYSGNENPYLIRRAPFRISSLGIESV